MRKIIPLLILVAGLFYANHAGYLKKAEPYLEQVKTTAKVFYNDISSWLFNDEPVIDTFHNKSKK